MKKLLVVFIVLLFACTDNVTTGDNNCVSSASGNFTAEDDSLGTKRFWVINLAFERGESCYNYQVDFVPIYENDAAIVMIEKAQSDYSIADVKTLADAFQNDIQPKITSTYGEPSDVDGNGKVYILLYDIQEGSNDENAFVGGYFYSVNLFSSGVPSDLRTNRAEIVFIDSKQAQIGSLNTRSTLAHEYQHLVGFVDRMFRSDRSSLNETWINEGLAEQAEYDIYGQSAIQSRFNFISHGSTFDHGNSLIHWENSLTDYAYAATFFNFAANKASNKTSFLSSVNTSFSGDHAAVGAAIGAYSGSSIDKFNAAYYEYSVRGLLNVESNVFPSVNYGTNLSFGTFAGIGIRSSKSYENYGYVPTFVAFPQGSSVSVSSAALMDVSSGVLSTSSSVSGLSAYQGNSYGVVFLTGLFSEMEKREMKLSETPITPSQTQLQSGRTFVYPKQRKANLAQPIF